jgi:hypothetical protein
MSGSHVPGAGMQGQTIASRVDNDFVYHSCSVKDQNTMADLRQVFHSTAKCILSSVPAGREQATALSKLEEVMFWSNAGISRSSIPDGTKVCSSCDCKWSGANTPDNCPNCLSPKKVDDVTGPQPSPASKA